MSTETATADQIESTLPPPSITVSPDGHVRCRPQPHERTYNNVLGQIAGEMDLTTEADKVAVFGSLLASVGVALGPAVRTQVGDSDHPLLAWFILCGPTSAGRKGTAGEVAGRVMKAALPAFATNNVTSGLSSGEGLIAAVADSDDPEAPPRDKRLLVIENEFANVMSRGRRDGNTLPGVLREAWDGRHLRVTTRSPLIAKDAHIGVVGHIAPKEFRRLISTRELSGGSYNRYLLLYVERSKMLPHGGGADPALVERLGKDLRARLEAASKVNMIATASAARAAWEDIYHEFAALEHDEQVAEWVARALPYTRRVAALHALMDGASEISAHHLQSAADLVRYGLASARYVLDAGSLHSDTEAIAKAIREAGPEGLKKSAITHRFGNRYAAAVLRDLLDSVIAFDGYEEVALPSTGGRPPTVFRYTPPAVTEIPSTI